MKRTFLILLCIVFSSILNAQEWEIDFGDAQSYIQYSHGTIDSDGSAVLVGGHAPVFPRYLPIAMRINPDGTHIEREYEGCDGLLLTDVVQLNNGNYFAAGDFSNEAVGVMVLDENLDIVAARRYERAGASLSVFGGKLLLDDDGTVVMSGTARYPSQYGGCEDRPYLYRFNENADTLRCRYVMAQMPAPEYYLFQYECHQILRDPRGDGLVLMGVGKTANQLSFVMTMISTTLATFGWITALCCCSHNLVHVVGCRTKNCWFSGHYGLLVRMSEPLHYLM